MATKDFSSKQEKMVASVLGWKVVAGSGAAACHPGDVISDMWLGECKTHLKPGQKICFKQDVWEKIKDEAYVKHRFPVLFTDDGTQNEKTTWCLCLARDIELENTVSAPLTNKATKNIIFDHYTMQVETKIFGSVANKLPIFTANLGGDDVIICQLSVFSQVKGE